MTDPEKRAFAALKQVSSRETFLVFVDALLACLEASEAADAIEPSSPYGPAAYDWENPTLPRFLAAMHAWGTDMGERLPETASWRTLADLLWAGKGYE
jgi:hypothetical protein